MSLDLNALLANATALIGILLGWWLNRASTARANADNDRTQLHVQADALVTAVASLKAAVAAHQHVRESWRQQLSLHTLAQLVTWGGAARVEGPRWRRLAAGGSALAEWASQQRAEDQRALLALPALMGPVGAAAAPLMQHADERVAAAAEAVLEAVNHLDDDARMTSALRSFGQAVRDAAQAPPSRWARLTGRLRRRPQVSGG
ncbi:hypothetical protein ABZ404_36950 [Streptomyces sp. NPDC005878]|uniref:hypothetical protein n=1 Tax=Streptomyces sp. NPDC005878 TaxID=3157077 RepID=UPI0034096442